MLRVQAKPDIVHLVTQPARIRRKIRFSNSGLGTIISHILPDGSEKAIAHASRTLTPTKRNYSQIECEASALIFALKQCRRYLYGRLDKITW